MIDVIPSLPTICSFSMSLNSDVKHCVDWFGTQSSTSEVIRGWKEKLGKPGDERRLLALTLI